MEGECRNQLRVRVRNFEIRVCKIGGFVNGWLGDEIGMFVSGNCG